MLTITFLGGINNVKPVIPLIIGVFIAGILVGIIGRIILFIRWRRRQSTSNTTPHIEKSISDIELNSTRGMYLCILPQLRHGI